MSIFSRDNDNKGQFTSWHINTEDTLVAATIIARMAALIDPNMDEGECFEIAEDFLNSTELNIVNITDLIAMFRCTAPNKSDVFH